MATAGLSFANPFMEKIGVGEEPNPYVPYSPTSNIGLGGLAPSAADMAVMGEALVKQSQFTMPEMRRPPAIAFSPSKQELFVNGITFAADDAATALQSESYLRGPGTQLPSGGDWVPLDEQAYSQYLQSIRQPSLGRLAAKSFGRGVDVMQALAGRGLQLAGAEELGGRIVAAQEEELRKTSPYERMFTDIESGRGAVEWLVSNFAQQGPNLIESVLTAGLGYLAGTVTGGPLTGVGAALAGLMGKSAFKEAVIAAAKKKAAGEVLNTAENKLLREAAGIAGAVTASYAQNLATGAADIYGELRDRGADAADVDARLKALAGSLPYAALETLPEYLLAGRVLGGVGAPRALPAGATRVQRGAELLRRGAVGGAIGGLAEGTTEAGQEALLLGISGQDLTSPEGVNRLINSFAAGFGVGGPIGAVANLRSRQPANLLDAAKPADPTPGRDLVVVPPAGPTPPAPPGTAVAPYYTPVTPMGAMPTPPEPLAGAPTVPQLPGPVQPVTPMGEPVMMVTPGGVAYPEQMLAQTGNVPPGAPGTQGVLDIFGGQIPAQELAARMQPAVTPAAPAALPAPAVMETRQGVLQFAPAAPTTPAPTALGNALQQVLQRQRVAQLQQQREAQLAAQREADLARLATAAAAQRQLDLAAPPPAAPMPMRQVGPTQPQQLELFTRRQAPRPSRAEALRRGAPGAQPVTAPVEVPQTAAQRRAQLPLFTQEGQPSVAALRAAGVRGKLPTPTLEAGAVQAPPTGAPVTAVTAAQARATAAAKAAPTRGLKKQAGVAKPKEEERAAKEGKLKQGRVAKRAENNAGIRARRQAGKQPKAQVPPSGAPAGGGGVALKRGEKPQAQEVAPSPARAALVRKAETAQAGRQWAQYADPDTQPKWSELSDAQKEQWRKVVIDDRKPSIAAAEEIAPPKKAEAAPAAVPAALPETDAELLADAIRNAEGATDTRSFKAAIATVVEYAFFDTDPNNRALGEQARAFLANTQFKDGQQSSIDEVFLDQANTNLQLTAVVKDKERPWFTYAVSRNLVPSLTAKIINMPAVYKSRQSPVSGVIATTKPVETTAQQMTETPQAKLGELISDLISQIRTVSALNQEVKFRGTTYPNIVELAKELYAKTDAAGRKYIVRGYPLSEYFTAKGEPKMLKSGGRFLISTKVLSTAEQRKLEQEQKEAAKALAEAEAEARAAEAERARLEKEGFREEDSWDNDDGMFYRDDGAEIPSTVPIGRIRLLVKSFLNKLRVKPTTFVYDNVADLKRRNPDLYRRAAAARKQGDFDTTKAAGYSFGPNVIIFSDFIRTEQQLKFILAHETLGHFGFKGVVPKAKLNETLNRIYDIDPTVQAGVDAMLAANEGMSKTEAIEEFLADNAADLDTSIIARIWNVLKNFLNKLGFQFQDDEARYFVNQARKYVRRGGTGQFVSARAVVGDMEQMDQDRDDGRYARYAAGDLASKAFGLSGLSRPYSATGGLMGAAQAFTDRMFGARRDVPGLVANLLEQLQTLDNKARRSDGLSQIYRIFEKQQQLARSLLSKYQRMTSFSHSPDVGFFGEGVSEQDKEKAGELLAHAALLRSQQVTDELLKKYPDLVMIDAAGNVTVDPRVRDEIEKAGFVTAEEFRKGFDIEYRDGEDKVISKVRFQFDVDENSPIWQVYKEMRETVNEAAIDLMLANFETAQIEGKRVISDLNTKRRGANVFTQDDLAAIRRAADMYKNMRYAGSDVANAGVEIKRKADETSEEFLVAFGRALFNDDVYAVWMKDPAAKPEIQRDLAEFQKAEYDDLRAALPSLRAKVKSDQQSFAVQKAIRDLFLFDLQSKNADYYAKRTILGSYVPFTRRGSEQVRLVAVDARGNPIALDENVRAILPYFQFDSRSEALKAAEELANEFGGDNEWTLLDDAGAEIKVRFKAEVSKVRQSPDLTEAVNFNEFVYVLNRLNINLTPQARERVVTTLTNQNARARRNLQRSGTPGWDKDVVRSISEHLETSAHVAAKKLYRHRLDDILLNDSNWLGDDQKLRALKAAVDNATSDGERARAKRAYDEYAYMYRYMKATGKGNTVEIDGQQVPTLGRGEDYREEAKSVLRWYSEAGNIEDSTEDMLSGEAGSRLKMLTVLMQLGGSVATAVINLASLVTHSMPYLSYYNSSRGFGGGYGESKAAAALWKAARDVANPKLSDDAFLNDLVEGREDITRFNLTEDEARFLFEQTEAGTLQAAQFNALVGTARGKVFNNKAQAAIKLWMSMFSYTEQANRRVTALAAYRLEKERLQSQGVTDEKQLIAEATEAARRAVNTAQGEYAMFNRPEMARGNVLQYIFMYKQFVIITVQLLRSMPIQGQLLMLGFLLLTSGLKGLPFAEDIFDIVDTISQKLGLKTPSIEKAMAEWIDSVAPGMTPYVMRGILDRVTGATMSTRLGMGDLLPLTGAFKAGADPAREVADFAGPVFGGIAGLLGTVGSLGKYGAEVIGLRDDTTSLTSILRDSPVAAVRAITDGLLYLNDGMITNARGQVVAKEAPYHVILARMLGFYPAIATEQNDIVRLSKQVADYGKAIKAEYVSAYVKAKLDNDTERMNEIAKDVEAWNEDAKGTGLEITSFVRSANRAALEASRPTALRYLKSAPKQMRPETIELLRINGLEDEIR